MKIGAQISLAIIIGFALLAGMRSCDPFAYLKQEDKFILKGAVEQ